MQSQGGPGNDIADVLSYDPPAVKQARLYFSSISASGIIHQALSLLQKQDRWGQNGQKASLQIQLQTKIKNTHQTFWFLLDIQNKTEMGVIM